MKDNALQVRDRRDLRWKTRFTILTCHWHAGFEGIPHARAGVGITFASFCTTLSWRRRWCCYELQVVSHSHPKVHIVTCITCKRVVRVMPCTDAVEQPVQILILHTYMWTSDSWLRAPSGHIMMQRAGVCALQ